MDSQLIRDTFLRYFEKHDHAVVASSPLIPAKDPTLLFTNAGMVPFKDVFLGLEKRDYKRATSIQKCVRAGGKHNDLEQVGFTTRHHTFFEMMGHFSFGDYFKKKAIELAWGFLINELDLDASRLWVTVHDSDDEAYALWTEHMGLSAERVIRLGDKDNFWQMADTGPCGPCTEIFYDHGDHIEGGLPGSPNEDGDRYVEIWNIVFMQYDRDDQGQLNPLPKPSVDTGMGLERIAAVLQGVCSNYDTQDFQLLMNAIQAAAGHYVLPEHALKLMADHLRAACFLIADQVRPSNEGRGYVLRRVIRRATRFAVQAGLNEPFLYRVVTTVAHHMGQAYPELVKEQQVIEGVLEREEAAFLKTVSEGMQHLDKALARSKGAILSGELMFQLYDTYGFPADLTKMIAQERGVVCDQDGFEQALIEQKKRSRQSATFQKGQSLDLQTKAATTYLGDEHQVLQAHVIELVSDHGASSRLSDEGWVVLDKTVCYPEGGGQIADLGIMSHEHGLAKVVDVQKFQGVIAHRVVVEQGMLTLGDSIQVAVTSNRNNTRAHHTATHLLHAALREVLGTHVVQKGSWVGPERLRFDFAHHARLTQDELDAVAALVNAMILANEAVQVKQMAKEVATSMGAMALFDEKYDDHVRVVCIGERSIELCGGSHVQRTGDIGLFVITQEKGIASGIRRIEALAAGPALEELLSIRSQLDAVAGQLKCTRADVTERVIQLKNQSKKVVNNHVGQSQDVLSKRQKMHGYHVLVAACDVPSKALRGLVDDVKSQADAPDVIVLFAPSSDGAAVVCGSKDARVSARALLSEMNQAMGGKGGGRDDFAQGRLERVSESALNQWLESWLSNKT